MPLLPHYRGPLTVHERTGERGFGGLSTHWCGNCGPVWTELDRARCPHCGSTLGPDDNHNYSFKALRRYTIHNRHQLAA